MSHTTPAKSDSLSLRLRSRAYTFGHSAMHSNAALRHCCLTHESGKPVSLSNSSGSPVALSRMYFNQSMLSISVVDMLAP